jgi:hypothetical protein
MGSSAFWVNLFDTAQRKPLAVLEANELTRFRTAALTAWWHARPRRAWRPPQAGGVWCRPASI